jgi:hypothetical protein
MERKEHARQVDSHHAIRVLERELHQWHRLADYSGVVERDVEPAVTIPNTSDQGGDVVFVADIGAHELGFPAVLLDLRHQSPPACLIEVRADHKRTLAGEHQRCSLADARDSATHHHDAVSEFHLVRHVLHLYCPSR